MTTFFFSHNGASGLVDTNIGDGVHRLARLWHFDNLKNNETGSLTISFDLANLGMNVDSDKVYRILTSSDYEYNNLDSNLSLAQHTSNISGNVINFNINVSDIEGKVVSLAEIDAVSFYTPGDTAVNEDEGEQRIDITSIIAPNESIRNFTVSTDNEDLITNLTVSDEGDSVFLSYQLAENKYGSAIITVNLDDGLNISNTFQDRFEIVVNPVNDAPAIDWSAPIYEIGSASQILDANFLLNEVEGDNIAQVVISIISNYEEDYDQLMFEDQLGITGVFDSTTGTLTLTGVASAEDYQTVIRTIRYTNTE